MCHTRAATTAMISKGQTESQHGHDNKFLIRRGKQRKQSEKEGKGNKKLISIQWQSWANSVHGRVSASNCAMSLDMGGMPNIPLSRVCTSLHVLAAKSGMLLPVQVCWTQTCNECMLIPFNRTSVIVLLSNNCTCLPSMQPLPMHYLVPTRPQY